MRPAFLFLVLSVPAWAWQEPQSNPQLALIRQVRQRMAENLTALPNYTCLETTDRSVRNQVKQKLLFRDKIHLEVAFIEASEMFCWPGSAHFESDLFQQLPQAGASGIGGFGGWTRALFGPSAPNFTYAGGCQFEGRHGARYTFSVPLRSSTYAVKFGGREAVSPHTGSLCLDPEALDIMQLEIRTTLTPPPVAAISEVTQYGRSRIGAVDFLLPQVDELTVTDLEGNENRNVTRFTACHEYTSESSVNFDPERTAAPGPQTPAEELQIPGGVSMALRLDTPITFEESAVGDAITARLNRAVKASGITIPKGALVSGRIRGLEQYFEPEKYFVVSLEFSSLTFGGKRALFRARLTGPRRQAERRLDSSGMAMESGTATPGSAPSEPSGLDIDDASPRFGVFRVRGGSLRLGRGLQMIWKTQNEKP